MRTLLVLALVTATPIACKKEPAPAPASAEPAPSASSVPNVDCAMNVPGDSEVSDVTESSFWIHPKGKSKFDGFLVVNTPVAFKPKTLDPRAKNEQRSVEKDLRGGGYHVEGTFEADGKVFHVVDVAHRCGATKLLACRVVSENENSAKYASRVCGSLVK
ncbi:MAG: hypothetical protein ACXVEF_20235 [Polyangiales bacterium]